MAERTQLFMKLVGDDGLTIEGESEAEAFPRQIEIDTWNWAMKRERDRDPASESRKKDDDDDDAEWACADGSKVTPTELTFTKKTDKATTPLLARMQSGKLLKAVITMTDSASVQGTAGENFNLVVTLSKVLVVQYRLSGEVSDKSAGLTENWTFDYQEVEFSYKPGRAGGTLKSKMIRPPGSPKSKLRVAGEDEKEFGKTALGWGKEKTQDVLFKEAKFKF